MSESSLSNFLLKNIIREYEKRRPYAGIMLDAIKGVPECEKAMKDWVKVWNSDFLFYDPCRNAFCPIFVFRMGPKHFQ